MAASEMRLLTLDGAINLRLCSPQCHSEGCRKDNDEQSVRDSLGFQYLIRDGGLHVSIEQDTARNVSSLPWLRTQHAFLAVLVPLLARDYRVLRLDARVARKRPNHLKSRRILSNT